MVERSKRLDADASGDNVDAALRDVESHLASFSCDGAIA
jgi:hypothetical protein